MRFKTIAKLLILLFVFLVILSGIRTCSRSISTSTTTYVPPPQVPQVPQQQTAPVASLLKVQPVILEKDKTDRMVRGRALYEVHAVSDISDTLTPDPIFTSSDIEGITDAEINLRNLTKNTIFPRYLLSRVRFFYYAGREGTYWFGIRQPKWFDNYGISHIASIRINGVQVIPVSRAIEKAGKVELSEGWYEIDFRQAIDSDCLRPSWKILVKAPDDQDMQVISKDMIFLPVVK